MTAQQQTLTGIDVSEFGGELDYWETPRWLTQQLVDEVIPNDRPYRWTVIEPCAGRGAMLEPLFSLEPCCVCAIELDPGRFKELEKEWGYCGAPVHGDFLTMDLRVECPGLFQGPRLVCTNPPFTKPRKTIGLEIVERCIEVAQPDGIAAVLLPLDFAHGVKRAQRIHDKYPGSCYPPRRRPRCGGDGNGKRPLAWFVWDLAEPKREFRVL